jgi:uncharacterized protein with ParB-like and HNH nuclease domain
MSIRNFGFKSLGTFLQESIYYIPDYQREYSWEDSEVSDFWMDLENVISTGMEKHFLGQIVAHISDIEGKKYIIDGQQRTCTAVILLAVFRDYFKMNYDASQYLGSLNKYEDIKIRYIGRFSDEVGGNELRLKLGSNDNEYFRDNIQISKPDGVANLTNSQKKIKNAYNYFDKRVTELVNGIPVGEQRHNALFRFYSALVDKFHVMYVETDDMNEAFVIFETLNARGKDLETADLLKNHIFRNAGVNLETVKIKWQNMYINLGKIDATRFIRHYYNSCNSFIREKDLYKRIRERVNSPLTARSLATELEIFSKYYAGLMNPDQEQFFSDVSKNEPIVNLSIMGATSYIPIILAMKKNYNDNDIFVVLEAIESLVFRNFVIAGKVSNRYETSFAALANGIYNQTLNSIGEILQVIKNETISDEEFKSAFINSTVQKKPVIRYIFQKIHNHLEVETRINNNTSDIHIEHIMPQAIGGWGIEPEIHTMNLWRLGNLTLLGAEYNQEISNSLFNVKRGTYGHSSIWLNHEISQYVTWGVDEIKDRQTRLAEISLAIWSR